MPFLYVQLPNFKAEQVDAAANGNSTWALLRESQLKTLTEPYAGVVTPNIGMVTTIDVGSATLIHPLTKKPVGERLALKARNLIYGENIISSCPMYESAKVVGNTIELTYPTGTILNFKSTGTLTTHQNFAVEGATNHIFYWANAVINGNKIIVSSTAVANPVALRYAWADNPNGLKLFNSAGLPASPFRLDFSSTARARASKAVTSTLSTKAISLNDNKVILYPNPSSGEVYIKTEINISKINVYNQIGALIKTINMEGNSKEIVVNGNDLPKGIYLFELQNDTENIWKKVIIN